MPYLGGRPTNRKGKVPGAGAIGARPLYSTYSCHRQVTSI